ncbi:polyprenyl synthetase family protein [Tichowtungia aerotolerans]|uniref:Polyprenyl synthetase family protein n=1 Tax=Tichowtungia aerotolerans TaxID=2697043 RepID=A0A6P1MGY6_9BACT|nr:polyprenyl synthetase family protein [Tichowtungia aerotolerans]QHI70846.1 hypothetical protein GT409_15825 [Tichowtungia aerotolerans]
MQKDTVYIENLIKDHLTGHSCWQAVASENPAGFEVLRSTLLAPGKRIRPLLFAAACRDFGVEPFPKLSSVALALELVHSFILIHDDLIDRSAVRRGCPTLHCAVEQWFQKNPSEGFAGEDFALVAGDLLFSMAIENVLKADVPEKMRQEMLCCFMQAAQETARGALLEMQVAQKPVHALDTDQIEEIYALKTGGYTFLLPLRLAEVCSGMHLPELDGAGLAAGISFQLKNDLKSIACWQETGEVPDDVRDHRRTWPLVYAGAEELLCSEDTISALTDAVGRKTDEALKKIEKMPVTAGFLRQILKQS